MTEYQYNELFKTQTQAIKRLVDKGKSTSDIMSAIAPLQVLQLQYQLKNQSSIFDAVSFDFEKYREAKNASNELCN